MVLHKASAHLYTLGNNSPINIYQFILNYSNTRKGCEICSKLIIKTLERHSTVFIVNLEHISHLVLVFLLLILSK